MTGKEAKRKLDIKIMIEISVETPILILKGNFEDRHCRINLMSNIIVYFLIYHLSVHIPTVCGI